ncbi:uncharacterized protein V1510DRAFT_286840, partial [Dipodascopsis tothii]|uniref:uncharacterized protein n=1 Tax=Dipodascopsis tothii TaxID=44089 RepID=UPI0034CEBECA
MASTGAVQGLHPAVAKLAAKLDQLAPRFALGRGQVEILSEPRDFYNTLKTKILAAKRSVFLATLYIGKSEHEFIETLQTSLRQNPDLQVSILTDALRGTREQPGPCCASLLAALDAEFGDRVRIRMFHTPNLRGLKKSLVPRRLNEGWGLQHMKLYGFDDEIVLSGANLSQDYFSDRQDRYYVFKSAPLTAYYRRIHDAVCSLSYAVRADAREAGFRLEWPAENPGPRPSKSARAFREAAAALLLPLVRPPLAAEPAEPAETVVYPVSQFAPLLPEGTSTEAPAVGHLLDMLSADNRFEWMFTAGYFNMHPAYRTKLLAATAPGTVVTAAPEANGFYKSAGISGALPPAYIVLAHRFLQDASTARAAIQLREWQRGVVNTPGGWSYHAKGIWAGLPVAGGSLPFVATIGSSNFTRRSHTLDLESNAIILTADPALRAAMAAEIKGLTAHTTEMTEADFHKPEREVGPGVRLALSILGGML